MEYQALPKYHETFINILNILNDKKILNRSEIRHQVQDTFYANLSPEVSAITTTTGQPLIQNRIDWGLSALVSGAYIEQPERHKFSTTEKGRKALKEGKLTLQQLKSDKDYQATEVARMKRNKPIENANSMMDDTSSPEDHIEYGISLIEGEVKSTLIEKLKKVDPYYFERIILLLLEKMGYGDIYDTQKSHDGGIDGVINQDKLGIDKIFIQTKRYGDKKIREPDIRNFIGAMSRNTTRGIFVTTSSFDDKAIKKAHDAHHRIILIDGENLVDLMYRYEVGIKHQTTYIAKQIDEDFFLI